MPVESIALTGYVHLNLGKDTIHKEYGLSVYLVLRNMSIIRSTLVSGLFKLFTGWREVRVHEVRALTKRNIFSKLTPVIKEVNVWTDLPLTRCVINNLLVYTLIL